MPTTRGRAASRRRSAPSRTPSASPGPGSQGAESSAANKDRAFCGVGSGLRWFLSTHLLGLATLSLSVYQLYTFTAIYINIQDGALFSQMHDTYSTTEMDDAFWLVEGFYESHSREHPKGWADPAGWITSDAQAEESIRPDDRTAERRVEDAFVELRGTLTDSPSDKFRRVDQARRLILHWYAKMTNLYSAKLLRRSHLLLHPGPQRASHFLRVVAPLARGSCRLHGHDTSCRDSLFNQVRDIMELGNANDDSMEAACEWQGSVSDGADARSCHALDDL